MRRAVVVVLAVIGLLVSAGPAHSAPSRASKLVMYSIGTDTHQTRLFRVNGSEWHIAWSYNCQSWGSKGNFSVEIHTRSGDLFNVAANQLGNVGRGTDYEHQGGTFYLDIDSECAWNIRVIGAGGGMLPLHVSRRVLSTAGSGTTHSKLFSVPSEWEIRWSFNCASWGGKGNFSLEVDTPAGGLVSVAVNELHESDHGTEYMHAGGRYYVSIDSECSWRVSVVR